MKKNIFIISIFLVIMFFCGVEKTEAASLVYTLPTEAIGNSLATLGYLDVQLYGADPTGVNDSSAAIERARNDAQKHQLVLYFTHQRNGQRGIYKISNTINCRNKVSGDTGVQVTNHLQGELKNGVRPLIKLAPGALGFQDSNNPKPMIEFWVQPPSYSSNADCVANQNTNDSNYNSAASSFDQTFRSIDIDCGGNPGAIGIENEGAQGQTIENVSINATGAFAGMGNMGGNGSAEYDVTVIGGRYGFYIDTTEQVCSPYLAHATFVGCKFINQTHSIVYNKGRVASPIAFVGCHVQNTAAIPFDTGIAIGTGSRGGFTFNDCVFDVKGGQLFTTTGALYIRNSYSKGISSIVSGWSVSSPNNWTWIKEYSKVGTAYQNLINGDSNTSTIREYTENINKSTESIEHSLVDFHTMDESKFPTISDNYYDVKANGGAHGDGIADDTTAIQNAISTASTQNRPVFFPKGHYRVNQKIELKSNSRVFGCSRKNVIISPVSSWRPSSETVIVSTENNANGTTILSDLNVGNSYLTSDNQYNFTPIEWRVGRYSLMRDVASIITSDWVPSAERTTLFNRFKVNGHGGGKWYGILGRYRVSNNTIRGLLIENTDDPMWIYPSNYQGESLNVQIEIINSSHKYINHIMAEGGKTVLRATNSDDIQFLTSHKNTVTETAHESGRGYIEFINCTNCMATMANSLTPTVARHLYESYNGFFDLVGYNIALYKRGNPEYLSVDGTLPTDNFPTIISFDVQPRNATSSVTVSYNVSDDVGLQRIEIWRAPYNVTNCNDAVKTACVWAQINSTNILGSAKTASGNYVDTSEVGTWWYGMHAVDTANQTTNETVPLKVIKTSSSDTTPPSNPTGLSVS